MTHETEQSRSAEQLDDPVMPEAAPASGTGTGEDSGRSDLPPTMTTAGEPNLRTLEGQLARLERDLAAEKEKAAEYLRNWQRSQADLANYRRRVIQEQQDRARYASSEVIIELLPALDNFERAISSLPPDLSGEAARWANGVLLIERQLRQVLDRFGVQPIPAQGQPFDPALHEAVLHEETAEHPDASVIAELQKGYKMHERILRPTLVKVAKARSPELPGEQGEGV